MESYSQYRNSPSEVISIKDEDSDLDINKNIQHKSKTRRRTHKQTRRVTLDTTKEKESLIITQKVKVKKQKFRCIINLTNICESTKKDKKKQHVSHKCRRTSQDRIVPQCLRHRCQSLISSKCCKVKESKEELRKLKSPNPVKKEKSSKNTLSLISSADLNECNNNISYEEISSGSFCSDNDLDTLIKRAKRREKKSRQEMSEEPLVYTSTPKHYYTASDCDVTPGRSSETTYSIHSMATLVLETDLNYSPIHHPFNNIKDSKYSPESPTDNLVIDTKSIDLSMDGSINLETNPANDSKLSKEVSGTFKSELNVKDECCYSNKNITELLDPKIEHSSPKLSSKDVEFCNKIPKIENVVSLNNEFLQEPLVKTENEMFEGTKRMKLGSGFIFEGPGAKK